MWEIDVDGYVLLMERNESYTTWDDYAIERGMWLMVFERSCLLDDLSHYTFANDRYPGKLAHYGVYCEDHLIDIVTDAIPIVRKLTAEEIHAWGIEDKDDSMVKKAPEGLYGLKSSPSAAISLPRGYRV